MNSNLSYLKNYCNSFEEMKSDERADVEWILWVNRQNLKKEML